MLFAVFSEIPTGVFADSFGRKKSILAGCFLFSASFLVYFLSFSFWLFVAAELIGALANAFISGALDAWVISTLKENNFNGVWKKVFIQEGDRRIIGYGLGGLFGAYLGNFDLSYPWLAGSISFFVMAIAFSFILKEEYFKKEKVRKKIFQIAKEGCIYSWKRKAIFYITLFGLVSTLVLQAINMQWQILLEGSFEMSVLNLGWSFFFMSVFMFIGNRLAEKFSEISRREEVPIILSQTITAFGIGIAAFFSDFSIIIAGLMIHQSGRAMLEPLKKTFINHRINDEKIRATVNSFSAMMVKGGAVIGLLISGYLGKNYSITLAWQTSAAILIASIPLFLKFNYRGKT